MGLESHYGNSRGSPGDGEDPAHREASPNLETSLASLENVGSHATFSTKTKIPQGILQGGQ